MLHQGHFCQKPLQKEVQYESIPSGRFPSAVSPSQLQIKNTVKTCEFVLNRFAAKFSKRDLASISQEEVLEFLLTLTKDNKQATKRNRYSVLASFYNFSISTGLSRRLPILAILLSLDKYSSVPKLSSGISSIRKLSMRSSFGP
ncbi:hypothetical protein FCL48_04465 [Desulforhopalus sp. IMCC35007]|nr:hypothetical protein FCL48_04465 [Desulforhopalus sp. IMCC35007]